MLKLGIHVAGLADTLIIKGVTVAEIRYGKEPMDEGEKRVDDILRSLPEDYLVLDHVYLEGTAGKPTREVDHIVIKRNAIICIESKNLHGKIKGQLSGLWSVVGPDNVSTPLENPYNQVLINSKVIKTLIKTRADHIFKDPRAASSVWVYPLIVFSHPGSDPSGVSPVIQYVTLRNLKDNLLKTEGRYNLTLEEMDRLGQILLPEPLRVEPSGRFALERIAETEKEPAIVRPLEAILAPEEKERRKLIKVALWLLPLVVLFPFIWFGISRYFHGLYKEPVVLKEQAKIEVPPVTEVAPLPGQPAIEKPEPAPMPEEKKMAKKGKPSIKPGELPAPKPAVVPSEVPQATEEPIPITERTITQRKTVIYGNLTLTLMSIEIKKDQTIVHLQARNYGDEPLELPIEGNFFIVDNLQNRYEADIFVSTLSTVISPRAIVVGEIVVPRPIDPKATIINIGFNAIKGQPITGPVNIKNISLSGDS